MEFCFALMLGVALALTADSNADPRSAYKQVPAQAAAQVTISISQTLAPLTMERREPQVIRTGDWPSRSFADAPGAQGAPQDAAPAIAIVIDDLGGDAARTNLAIALPADVTLSFLPYPPRSRELSHRAHLAGHEILVHLPMQPAGSENPGERALTTGLAPEEVRERMSWALSRVADYDGVNNHMGSRFTASSRDLTPVMSELKARRLFFLDSRTTANSEAERIAHEMGVLTGRRDVFLDGEQSVGAIKRQLSRAEDFARKNGTVIAIGHPYPETLQTLSAWTKTINERGYRLVPLREVLASREGRRAAALVTAGISFKGPE